MHTGGVSSNGAWDYRFYVRNVDFAAVAIRASEAFCVRFYDHGNDGSGAFAEIPGLIDPNKAAARHHARQNRPSGP